MKRLLAALVLMMMFCGNAFAVTATPIFLQAGNCASCEVSAANTAADGSGVLVTLFTAGANGSRIDGVVFTSAKAAVAANSAMVCRVFVTDTAGANPRLRAEVALPAVTSSNTAIGATATVSFTNGLVLQSGQLVKVCQSLYAGVQDKVQVFVVGGGDY